MNYIKLSIIALTLTSCATTETMDTSSSEVTVNVQSTHDERNAYQNALTLLNNEKLDAARVILLQLNEEKPELAGPYANLAIIALRKNKPAQALDLVKTALSKNPNLAQALNLLAYLEQVSGEIKSAEKHYKEAIKNKNDYAIAHYNIALLYDVYLQDIEKAIPHYEKYMELINHQDKNTADWLEQIKQNKDKG